MFIKLCETCQNPIKPKKNFPSEIKKRTFCSIQCAIPSRAKKRKSGTTKHCKMCKNPIYAKKCLINRKKFCSKQCKHTFYKGQHLSKQTEFKKGKAHKYWRGENAVKYFPNYQNIHRRIRQKWGTPNYCEFCKTTTPTKKYAWANIPETYTEDKKDWKRLCYSCHITHDLIK